MLDESDDDEELSELLDQLLGLIKKPRAANGGGDRPEILRDIRERIRSGNGAGSIDLLGALEISTEWLLRNRK